GSGNLPEWGQTAPDRGRIDRGAERAAARARAPDLGVSLYRDLAGLTDRLTPSPEENVEVVALGRGEGLIGEDRVRLATQAHEGVPDRKGGVGNVSRRYGSGTDWPRTQRHGALRKGMPRIRITF